MAVPVRVVIVVKLSVFEKGFWRAGLRAHEICR